MRSKYYEILSKEREEIKKRLKKEKLKKFEKAHIRGFYWICRRPEAIYKGKTQKSIQKQELCKRLGEKTLKRKRCLT